MTHAILPWPPKELSPNARVHWAKKAKAAKKYKSDCLWEIWHDNPRAAWKGATRFSIEFCPPSARRYDIDNCLASIKPAIDALSHASGVDDSEFSLTIRKSSPVKGGGVIVQVLDQEAINAVNSWRRG